MQQVQPENHHFTTGDYHQMVRSGILREDARVELVEGEVKDMAPIGARHAACVTALTELFYRQMGARTAVVWVQNPLGLGEYSEPQPDVTLLRWRPDRYRGGEPGPDDVLLLIEVADTTLLYDRNVKVPRYARAGIPEVWVVDLSADSVIVHREPGPQGYHAVSVLRGDDMLAPQTLPGVAMRVTDILSDAPSD